MEINKLPLKKEDEEQCEKPVCFVIMPFSDPEPYPKGHFDKVYRDIFVPAINYAGYAPQRVDEDFRSSSILAKIVHQLVHAPMALCDLSAHNPNVLYELGIRHAFDMPIVLVREVGSNSIFDLSDITTIPYRKERIYDEVFDDQKKIAQAITETASDKGKSSVIYLAKIEKAKEGLNTSPQEQPGLMLQSLANDMSFIKNSLASRLVERNPIKLDKPFAWPNDKYEKVKNMIEQIENTMNNWPLKVEFSNSDVREVRWRLELVASMLNELEKYDIPSNTFEILKEKVDSLQMKSMVILGKNKKAASNIKDSVSS